MQLSHSRLYEIFKDFNRRAFTWPDFERIAKRERIKWQDFPLPDELRGFYVCQTRRVYKKRWIVFNENLGETERLFTAFHELAHHFLHVGQSSRVRLNCPAHASHNNANDIEADIAALIWIIPERDLRLFAIASPDDIPPALVPFLVRRKEVWEKFGI